MNEPMERYPARAAAVAAEDAATIAAARETRDAVVRLARRLRTSPHDREVSGTGIALMARLWRDGSASPKALAEGDDITPQALTRVIAALEERGLIRRRPDPSDGRGVLLDLTEEGMRALQAHARAQTMWLADAMDAQLSPAEREMVRVTAALLERLADHRSSPS